MASKSAARLLRRPLCCSHFHTTAGPVARTSCLAAPAVPSSLSSPSRPTTLTTPPSSVRAASTRPPPNRTPSFPLDDDVDAETVASTVRPRWATTPPATAMPVRVRPRPEGLTEGPRYSINTDPQRLDEALARMLGRDGHKGLDEEVKWLAVTHKSFDHGRRGFNDRMAYLGKRIVDLQTSLTLLATPRHVDLRDPGEPDMFGRVPFQHPALQHLPNLTDGVKRTALDRRRLARLAENYGLDKVTRWVPRKSANLQASGVDTVLATTLYAIVGAVALQRGGSAANQVVRDRILNPLGLV